MPGRQLAQIDILGNGHLRNQMQLLVDDGDATFQCIDRVLECYLVAAKFDHAIRGRLKTTEYFQQGGFAGTILAHQGVDSAFLAREGDILQRLHAGKLFADATKFQIRD